ncbi:hypothetical protein [Tenacibaculum jejuense]|uniref:Uncharacterized protein n=1 Tax=Tenacibaculum jejuense TaxID=584609 RepID=A0A238UET5_9FLAO|nr:hypothetical protein [Tenacibaculum jejuense]SNR17612.1 conserved membrane protein of unknown function [Tenacibaculum jejuense]
MLLHFILGFITSYFGFAAPSMLNLTVGKIFIDENKKSARHFIFGAAIVVFFQFLLSLIVIRLIHKFPDILLWIKNIAVLVFVYLSFFYLNKEFSSREKVQQVCNQKTCFSYGIKLSFINMFAIPFFALAYSFFIAKGLLSQEYDYLLSFGIGTSLGVVAVLSSYILLIKKIEAKVTKVMVFFNPLMSIITGFLAIVTLIKLYF